MKHSDYTSEQWAIIDAKTLIRDIKHVLRLNQIGQVRATLRELKQANTPASLEWYDKLKNAYSIK